MHHRIHEYSHVEVKITLARDVQLWVPEKDYQVNQLIAILSFS